MNSTIQNFKPSNNITEAADKLQEVSKSIIDNLMRRIAQRPDANKDYILAQACRHIDVLAIKTAVAYLEQLEEYGLDGTPNNPPAMANVQALLCG